MRKFAVFIFVLTPALLLAQDTISRYSQNNSSNALQIGLNAGPVFLFGDIGMENYTPPFSNRLGYSFFAEQKLAPFLDISLNLLAGKVYGEKQAGTENINFRTSIFSQSLRLYYNFHPLISHNDKTPFFSPFLSAGVESVIFRPKADLKDAKGNTYNYWDDGSIRDLPQEQQNVDNSQIIEWDYEYESELRDANLDGFGKYPLIGFSLPLSAGINLNLSKHFAIRLEGEYHLTFTDYIDNITSESLGVRQGNSANDKFLYASAGVVWQIAPSKAKVKIKPPKDSDKDGVPDIVDKCRKTPKGVAVDENGCPLAQSQPKKTEEKPEEKNYHWGDLNKNGTIEVEEVNECIERFLDGDKSITIKQIDDLLEYYFEQE